MAGFLGSASLSSRDAFMRRRSAAVSHHSMVSVTMARGAPLRRNFSQVTIDSRFAAT